MKTLRNQWKIGFLLVGLIIFLFLVPTLSSLSDRIVLPFLSKWNIFSITRSLVTLTDNMISETAKLQKEVSKAGNSLSALDRQDALLSSQIQTSRGIQMELEQQLNGNVEARGKMGQILSKETDTFQLTSTVSTRANQITNQMGTTLSHLKNVESSAGSIASNSQNLNHLLDQLLSELAQSERNFHFIGRIPRLLDNLENQIGLNLPIPRSPQKNTSHSPLNQTTDDATKLPQILLPQPDRQGKTDNQNLLNLLLP